MSKVYGICSTEANVRSICADIINNQQPSKACMRSEEDTKKRAAVDTIHMAITGHLDWTTATYSSTCTVDHDEVARGSLSESSVAKLLLSIVVDFFKDLISPPTSSKHLRSPPILSRKNNIILLYPK
jgi:hypothetical protein